MRLKMTIAVVLLAFLGAVWSYEHFKQTDDYIDRTTIRLEEGPPCVQLYDLLQKYSEKYEVPFRIAYGIAVLETSYGGPFDWNYDPKKISPMNAYGAMQVQVPTAEFIWGRKVTKERLLNDMDFNVETSMRLMKHLYGVCGRWDVALGYYNTGKPMINGYSNEVMRYNKK